MKKIIIIGIILAVAFCVGKGICQGTEELVMPAEGVNIDYFVKDYPEYEESKEYQQRRAAVEKYIAGHLEIDGRIRKALLESRVVIGMDKEAVRAVFGRPTEMTDDGNTWYYLFAGIDFISIGFKDGRVDEIKSYIRFLDKRAYEKFIKDIDIEKPVYIPEDIRECFLQLKEVLTPEQIKEFMDARENRIAMYHHSMGRWIRDSWGLWSKSPLTEYFNKLGIYYPDDMSEIVLVSFHRHLNNKDIRIEEQVKEHQEYWIREARKRLKEEVGSSGLNVAVIAPSASTYLKAAEIIEKNKWLEVAPKVSSDILVVVRSGHFYPLKYYYDSYEDLEDDAKSQPNTLGSICHIYLYQLHSDSSISGLKHYYIFAEDVKKPPVIKKKTAIILE